jgi:hypothetical protein
MTGSTRITPHVRLGTWLALCATIACAQERILVEPPPPHALEPNPALLISDPVFDGASMVYVSLRPGTIAYASSATITAASNASTPIADGGFDPVAVVASVGDTVHVVVYDKDRELTRMFNVVPARRAPEVLRTNPGRADAGCLLMSASWSFSASRQLLPASTTQRSSSGSRRTECRQRSVLCATAVGPWSWFPWFLARSDPVPHCRLRRYPGSLGRTTQLGNRRPVHHPSRTRG